MLRRRPDHPSLRVIAVMLHESSNGTGCAARDDRRLAIVMAKLIESAKSWEVRSESLNARVKFQLSAAVVEMSLVRSS